jgi:hypothetical protein
VAGSELQRLDVEFSVDTQKVGEFCAVKMTRGVILGVCSFFIAKDHIPDDKIFDERRPLVLHNHFGFQTKIRFFITISQTMGANPSTMQIATT